MRSAALVLLVAGPLAAAPPAPVAAFQDHIRTLIEDAEPSVVGVAVSHHPGHGEPDPNHPGRLGDFPVAQPVAVGPFGPPRLPERNRLDLSDPRNAADHTFGSGVVLDDRAGLVLTAYHLIDGARKVYVRHPNGRDGWYADIHAADARSDLAVLRLRPPAAGLGERRPAGPAPLKPVRLADVRTHDTADGMKATVFRGQWVVALAHPLAGGFADGPASASWGIVGNVRRRLPANLPEEQRTGLLTQYGSLIQTDARLALGSSGGALFNLDGELIGLTAATAAVTGSEAAGGFAVPMDPIYRGIVGVLREGREVEYGFLGVSPGDFVPDGDRGGLVIARVTDRSPADRAGLQSRDVIRAIDGRPIRDADDLFLLVGGSLAGREVSITYTRGTGRVPQTATATLAKFVHPHPWIASVRPPAVYGLRVEWSSVLAQQNGPGLRNPSVPDGVVVRELDPKGAAAAAFQAAGLAAGKVLITRVNGTPVQTPADFYRAAGRGPVRLGVTDLARPDAEPRTITVP